MKALSHFPLFTILLILYNALAFVPSQHIFSPDQNIFSWVLPSGAVIKFTFDMIVVLLGLVVLFIEILKSTRSSIGAIIDHGLSTLVFIVFLLEFVLVPETGTWGFLCLTLLTLLDVIAGFTISISGARRDFSIER